MVFGVVPSKNGNLCGTLSELVSQEKWFIFSIRLFIVLASLSCSFPFVSDETQPNGYLVGKEELVILLFCYVLCISFLPGVYVRTLKIIVSIPVPFILTWHGLSYPTRSHGNPIGWALRGNGVSSFEQTTSTNNPA